MLTGYVSFRGVYQDDGSDNVSPFKYAVILGIYVKFQMSKGQQCSF